MYKNTPPTPHPLKSASASPKPKDSKITTHNAPLPSTPTAVNSQTAKIQSATVKEANSPKISPKHPAAISTTPTPTLNS